STAAAVSVCRARRVRGHPGDIQPVQPRKPRKLRNAREQRKLREADSDPEPRLSAADGAAGVPGHILSIPSLRRRPAAPPARPPPPAALPAPKVQNAATAPIVSSTTK